MRLITAYQTNNDCYKTAQIMPKGKPEGIVVHSTGANNPYLKRYVDAPAEVGVNQYGNHWNRSGVSKMAHGFIGLDKDSKVAVVNTLPYNYCCWGCGNGKYGSYNYAPAYVQFEVCEDNLKNADYFNEVYRNAIEYSAYLCKEFGISVDNVVSHREAHARGYASNHSDIDNWLSWHGLTMNDFRAEVRKELEAMAEEEKKEEPTEESTEDKTEDEATEESTEEIYTNEYVANFFIKLLNSIIDFLVNMFGEKRK
jgi:N-acetylmuramoyl-L-alanine amidase CwlA